MRKYLFGVLSGIIITGSVVFAATKMTADNVYYTDSNNVERTVDTVLNDLYTEAGKDLYEHLGTPTYDEEYGTAELNRTLSKSVSKGKYLAVISEGQGWGYTSEVYGASTVSANISCTSNNCILTKLSGRFIRVPSSTAQRTVNNKYFLYYIEIKENTDTINILQGSTTATTTSPQYINLTLFPIN